MEFGVGLDFDSADYVHVARQMQAGEPLLRFDARDLQFTWAPPLYPAMLVAVSGGFLDPLDVAGPLNAALFGGMVLLCGAFLRRRLAARPLWAWCGCAAIALSPPVVAQAATAMATQPFALFVAGALICVAGKDPGGGRLAFAAVFTGLACMTRYSGVALLVVVSAVLLLASDLHWIKRLRRAAAYALVAFAPLGFWLLRNQLLAGKPTGDRVHEAVDLPITLGRMGEEMAKWVFLDLPTWDWFGAAWRALLAFVALFSLCVAALRKRIGRAVWRLLVVFGGFILATLMMLVIAAELGAFVEIETRYLTPLYVPCLVVAWLLVGELLGANTLPTTRRPMRVAFQRPRRVALVVGMTLVVAPWLLYQGVMHKSAIVERNLQGFYYDGPKWRDSEALRDLRNAMPTHGRVHVDLMIAPAVFFHTDIRRISPYNCGARGFGRDGDYLLWLQVIPDRCLLAGQGGTFATPGLEQVAAFADGVLLRFNAASPTTLADAVWAHLVPNDQPLRSAPWALHLNAERRELVFAKAPCATGDGAMRFFVHVHAHSNDALPPHRRESGFDNLDFDFPQCGLILPGPGGAGETAMDGEGASAGAGRRCVAVVELPRYPLASLRVGQFAEQELWSLRVDFDSDDGRSALRWRLGRPSWEDV